MVQAAGRIPVSLLTANNFLVPAFLNRSSNTVDTVGGRTWEHFLGKNTIDDDSDSDS